MNSLYTIGCIICKFSLTVLTLSFLLNPSAHSLLICNLRLVVTISGQDAPWRRDRLRTPVFLGFPCGSVGKESTHSAGDPGWIPGLGRPPGDWNDYLLQYSGLENSMDYIVHGFTKSRTRLSDFRAPSSLLCCVHRSILYMRISILALK